MGRVLAHELYHIFTHTRKHGRHGIAKGVYTARELVSRTFRFDAAELASMRDSGLIVRLGAPANSRVALEGGGR
jgi:hypothetical protein